MSDRQCLLLLAEIECLANLACLRSGTRLSSKEVKAATLQNWTMPGVVL